MRYKEINLVSNGKESIETEVMYEIAAARADNIELIKLIIPTESSEQQGMNKITATIIRRLKIMKQGGYIQFYAGKNDFVVMSTPAHFLINKYSEYFTEINSDETLDYLYVKI